jgi:hypothetical protein
VLLSKASLSHFQSAGLLHQIDSIVMPSFLSLPAEILALILRDSNINGDLAQLRLACSNLNTLILQDQNRYLQDICIIYGISQRVLDIYSTGLGITQSQLDFRNYLVFRHELAVLESLSTFLKRETSIARYFTPIDNSVGPLLLFSAFARIFNTGSPGLQESLPVSDALRVQHFFKVRLELAEVEALITTLDMCTSVLWPRVSLANPNERLTVESACPGVDGSAVQQSMLMEYVIRRGPKWTAQILGIGSAQPGSIAFLKDRYTGLPACSSVWEVSAERGARIASAGVARMLWMERRAKIEEEHQRREHEKLERQKIVDMRVNAGIWRGSAGDM